MIGRIVKRIILVPEAMLIASGHEPGPCRTTERMRHIPIRAAHPFGGEPVKVRRGDVFATLEADVGIALVVGDDQKNVGFVRRSG